MEDAAILNFACTASRDLANVALSLSEQKGNKLEAAKLVDFAARLVRIAEDLDRPTPGRRPPSTTKLVRYLKDLERLCIPKPATNQTWSPPSHKISSDSFKSLHDLSKGKAEPSLSTDLEKHLSSPRTRGSLYSNLDRFFPRKKVMKDEPVESVHAIDGVPRHLLASAYAALHSYSGCCCPNANGTDETSCRHTSHVKLIRNVPKQSSAAFLDVAYRPAMTHEDRSKGMWTLLRLTVSQQRPLVAWKSTADPLTAGASVNKHVQGAVHADSGPKTPTRASQHDERMTCLAFCELLLRRRGPVCHLVHISGKKLVDRRRVEPASQNFAPQPSQLLSDLWKHRTLSDDGKLLLAHSVAKSVWEFYDTEFMPRRWTAADIAFVPEQGPGERLNPAHPFAPLVLSPAQQNLDNLDHEFVPNEGLVHWAPRIFSLGVLLTRVMSDKDVTIPGDGLSWQERFNSEFFYCRETILRDDWPSLKLRNKYVQTTLRTAILACLGGEIFNNDSWDVEDRRAALQKHLVAPLESLLSVVGAKEQSAVWQPRPNETDDYPTEPAARGSALSNKHMSNSQRWLERLASSTLNREISLFYKTTSPQKKTKIAILDTGYDKDVLFFSPAQRRKRILSWRDFVEGNDDTIDEDGHGTQVLSIAMKVAPSADIVVARVAQTDQDFAGSYDRISKAIDWAVNDMDADIVSMSFGWPKAHESPEVSQAIFNATARRQGHILFFAAASNSGGDYGEWFPASHEMVQAVRATTHEGEFVGFNPPPDFAGADVIGTLGVDVLTASKDPEQPECTDSGTSFACPIAAAMSALIIDAAKLCKSPHESPDYRRLHTRKGMQELFRSPTISRKMRERTWYLNGFEFCSRDADDRKAVLRTAVMQT